MVIIVPLALFPVFFENYNHLIDDAAQYLFKDKTECKWRWLEVVWGMVCDIGILYGNLHFKMRYTIDFMIMSFMECW